MAIAETERSELVQALTSTIGERPAHSLMSSILPEGTDHLATRADVKALETKTEAGFVKIHAKVDGGFAKTGAEFVKIHAKVDGGFAKTGAEFVKIHAKVDGGFAKTEAEFVKIHAKVDGGFAKTEAEFVKIHAKVDGGFAKVEGEFAKVYGVIEGLKGHFDLKLANQTRTMLLAMLACVVTTWAGMLAGFLTLASMING